MPQQMIVYSASSGRVRRVIDPECEVTDLAQVLAKHPISPGEVAILYQKKGAKDDILAWQAAASLHCRRVPVHYHHAILEAVHAAAQAAGVTLQSVSDRHVIVDSTGTVVRHDFLDLSIDKAADLVPGHFVIPHDTAQRGWKLLPALAPP